MTSIKTVWDIFLPCLYSFAACMAFCVVFNMHRQKHIVLASLGSSLGWLIYLLCGFYGDDIFCYFMATIVISIYAEIMARIFKTPVTTFLLVALLPLVPGGGIYYTMEYCINGNITAFVEKGLHTLGIAGAIAVGILVVSSFVRLWHTVRIGWKQKVQKSQ